MKELSQSTPNAGVAMLPNPPAAAQAAPPLLPTVSNAHIFQAVCQSARLAICVVNADQRCAYLNRSAERLLGLTLEEAKGRPLTQLLESSGTIAFDTTPIRDGGDKAVGAIIELRSPHEDTRAHSLLASEDYLRTAIDSSAGGFYGIDGDGVTLVCNNAFVRMLGFSRMEDAVGRKLHDVIHHTHPDGAPYPKEECPIYQCARTGKPAHVPFELFFRLDGSSFPVEYWTLPIVRNGQVDGAVTTFIDITDRQRADQALHEARARLEAAVSAGEIGTFRWDIRTNELSWDRNLDRLFGLPEGQTVRTLERFIERVHPDDRGGVLQRCARCASEGANFDMEFRVVWPDGTIRWLDDKGKTFFDPEGKPLYMTGACVDITARKRAEEERQALLQAERCAREAAEDASRLKDDFLATLSHELRTPLNAIIGWASVLRRRTASDGQMNEALGIIERNAHVQVQLVEDLLDMSRIAAGKLRLDVQRVDIAEVIQAAVDSVRPAAEAKEIDLHTVLDTQVAPVRGDMARLQQVVWNLLSNAIKFTPKGGKVQVALQRVNSHVEITVTDSGIGISPDFLPYVFERFRQAEGGTNRRHHGLGIGLAIVKNLVEMHGGMVRAKSPGEGLGSIFSVELPVMVVQEDQTAARRHPTLPSHGGEADFCGQGTLDGITVLVVDDDRDARELVRQLLEDCKARVSVAADAAEAFELLRQTRPQVVLSDIGMPGEDGYTFIQRVRELSPRDGGDTPAIALTAFARSEDRRRALLAGFQAHVAKPVEPAELIAVVASVSGAMMRKRRSRM